MKNVFTLLFSLVLPFIVSCASVRTGDVAKPLEQAEGAKASASGIILSGKENRTLTNEYVMALDVTFENGTSKWLRVEKAELDFGDAANPKLIYPSGGDLVAWAEARQREVAIEDYNTSLILGSVMAAGAVVASTSNNSSAQMGGIAAIGIGGIALTARDINKQLGKLENNKVDPYSLLFPDTHLFNPGFTIPPASHTKKWVAVYTETPEEFKDLKSVKITLHLEGNKKESFELPFRLFNSPWGRKSAQRKMPSY